jgi:hypothetical protein
LPATSEIGDFGNAESLVDLLLPNRADEALDDVTYAKFVDAGVEVRLSAVDQLLLAITRKLVSGSPLGNTLIIQLARARQRTSLLLAITSHLLCRQSPVYFSGPVVLVGLDVDLANQLRHLSVQGHRRMGLASGNPLSAHRLTRSGELEPLIGSAARPADQSLVYFNTRVGQPPLSSDSPLVILDATSVTSPAARVRALEWSLDRHIAGIVVVSDICDDSLVETVKEMGLVPTVLALTETVVAQLVSNFGRQEPPESTLSSMSMLYPTTSVVLHDVVGDEINEAVTRCYQAIGSKPAGPMPSQLNVPVNLLRNGVRLAARAGDYRTACTYNIRPGEAPGLHWLKRMDPQLPREWMSWKATRWGSLRTGVIAMWDVLEIENPKLTAMWKLLDRLERDTEGPIVIRCHSRAAIMATQSSLAAGDRTTTQEELWSQLSGRVSFATMKERFPAGSFSAQILTGAPPPWLLSLLFSIEAEATHVLVYGAEAAALRRQGDKWAETANGWQRASCRTLGAKIEADVASPVPAPSTTSMEPAAFRLEVPGLSIAALLDAASASIEPSEVGPTISALTAGSSTKMCTPITLDDGRTWWCEDEEGGSRPVLVVTAGGHEYRPVDELRPGDCVIVPAGEGTESLHARLVAASRGNDDVQALDMILSQFRSAARAVLDGRTQRDAIELVRDAGAEAADQLVAWARGSTIAPREPGDVAAVFLAAHRQSPDLRLIYAVAGTLRNLSRTIGKFIAAMSRGQGDNAVEKLREIVGEAADEMLDEFIMATITNVGNSIATSSSLAGRIR